MNQYKITQKEYNLLKSFSECGFESIRWDYLFNRSSVYNQFTHELITLPFGMCEFAKSDQDSFCIYGVLNNCEIVEEVKKEKLKLTQKEYNLLQAFVNFGFDKVCRGDNRNYATVYKSSDRDYSNLPADSFKQLTSNKEYDISEILSNYEIIPENKENT